MSVSSTTLPTSHSDMLLALGAELLREGRPIRFRATGHSMTPTIKDGDIVEVAPMRDRTLRPDDIAFYRGRRGAVAHRVVALEDGGGVVTRGDSCLLCDASVSHEAILGRVVAVERGGRRVAVTGAAARARRWSRRLAARAFRALVPST